MFDELRKIPVFVIRDFRMLFTYKLAFSMSFFTIIINLFYLVLFGSMFVLIPGSLSNAPSGYEGNFIYFILVGSIGWGFMWSIMNATSLSLSTEMMMGTLESILVTSTRMSTLMLSYALFGCIFGLLQIIILIIVGSFIFGISVFATATVYTLIIFILSIVMMTGFGMIFGGLTIWLKNIGETVPLLQSVSVFFCGVYFTIDVLPEFMRPIANYIPFYYPIEGLRRSLNPAASTSEIMFFVGILLALSIISIILGVCVLHLGLTKAKKDGSLAFY